MNGTSDPSSSTAKEVNGLFSAVGSSSLVNGTDGLRDGAKATGAGAGDEKPTDLWSSILDSVSSSRAVPTKNVIVLGEHNTGKSTLVSALSSSSSVAGPSSESLDKPPASNGDQDSNPAKVEHQDLGLSYNYIDIGDESDEETLARLGIYQLPSPYSPYSALLPLSLTPQTLLDSIAVIVLDWEKPWDFLASLRRWLGVLQGVLELIQGGKTKSEGGVERGEWIVEEAKDRVEAFVRAYLEPPTGATVNGVPVPPTLGAAATLTAAGGDDEVIPLPKGTLTDNIGLGLVIVCTKADHINVLERDATFTEEQFDYIQQALRTICLRYGAALFFTSHSRPTTFQKLRSYILHRLFTQPSSSHASAPAQAVTSPDDAEAATAPNGNGATSPTASVFPQNLASSSAAPSTSTSRSFTFPYRANVVDRDQIVVPSGWDSWGKIRVLREGFNCDEVSNGWELDVRKENERRRKMTREREVSANGVAGGAAALIAGVNGHVKSGNEDDEDEEEIDEDGRRVVGACRLYLDMVPDDDDGHKSGNQSTSRITVQDEQEFLRGHFEALLKDQPKDPRQHFQARQPTTSNANNPNAGGGLDGDGSGGGRMMGVVGPMGNTSFSLPRVELALERDVEEPLSFPGLSGSGVGSSSTSASTSAAANAAAAALRGARKEIGPPSSSLRSPLSNTFPNLPSLNGMAPQTPSSSANRLTSPLTSPGVGGGASGAAGAGSVDGKVNNEVLQDFFQRLISARGGKEGGSGGSSRGGGAGGSAGGGLAALANSVGARGSSGTGTGAGTGDRERRGGTGSRQNSSNGGGAGVGTGGGGGSGGSSPKMGGGNSTLPTSGS